MPLRNSILKSFVWVCIYVFYILFKLMFLKYHLDIKSCLKNEVLFLVISISILFIFCESNMGFFLSGGYYIQIMWLADIFRAKVVDISEHFVTIEVTLLLHFHVIKNHAPSLAIFFFPLSSRCFDLYYYLIAVIWIFIFTAVFFCLACNVLMQYKSK